MKDSVGLWLSSANEHWNSVGISRGPRTGSAGEVAASLATIKKHPTGNENENLKPRKTNLTITDAV
jgi:hypothetical protein